MVLGGRTVAGPGLIVLEQKTKIMLDVAGGSVAQWFTYLLPNQLSQVQFMALKYFPKNIADAMEFIRSILLTVKKIN